MRINYQKELDKILEELERTGKVPRLLLHSCCAPCSSYVLEYLSKYFRITVFYYNPNICRRKNMGNGWKSREGLPGNCRPDIRSLL